MSYYHYTKGCHLPSIVRDGIIQISKSFLDEREKPATWLTKSPEWEVGCNIGIVTNSEELTNGQYHFAHEINSITVNNNYMKREIGMCRIVIDENLPTISWAKHKYVSGISPEYYRILDRQARSDGSPVDMWRCTFKPVPKKYWKSIEIFVDKEWVKWDETIPIEEFVSLCLDCNQEGTIKSYTK